MGVPKRKTSKMKIRSRVAANSYKGLQPNECSVCHAAVLPHRVCSSCGSYKGKQVITVSK